jgi:outer membrane beta-barrel protein
MTRTEHGSGNPSSATRSRGRRTLAACILLALLAVAPSASAADGAPSPSEDDGDVGGPLDEELDNYWSVDRDVEVIKDKLYEREGRVAVGLFGGLMSSEPFFWYNPVGGRVDYYVSNQFGIEVEGMYMGSPGILRHDTDLTDFLQNNRGGAFKASEDTLDQFVWRAHALAVWHPLYGKLAFLQRKLAHFDLNLSAGLGAVQVQRPNATRTESSSTIEPNFVFGGGVQFFINEHITLRLEGRGNVYRGPLRYKNNQLGRRQVTEPTELSSNQYRKLNFFQRLNFTADFLAGVSYMF